MADYGDPLRAHERLSNDEREVAVRALSDGQADGRLSPSEFEERAGVARAAVTRAELAPLFSDLPGGTTAGTPGTGHIPSAPIGRASYASAPLGGRVGTTVIAVVPFVALALFLITGSAGGWALGWLWFLMIPVAWIIVRGPGGRDDTRR